MSGTFRVLILGDVTTDYFFFWLCMIEERISSVLIYWTELAIETFNRLSV
jgi:hypothetical protein